jgi:hypothetical protein
MAIEFHCPQCNKLLRVADQATGKQAMCPECGEISRVPGLQGPPDSNAAQTSGIPPKPGKVSAIAIMMLVGGCLAAISAAMNAALVFSDSDLIKMLPRSFFYFTIALTPYEIILAVLTITKGMKLLRSDAWKQSPPKTIAIMQIVNIVACDATNPVLGIIILVFSNDPKVKAYFRSQG